jgi:hypothetical protein
MKQKNIKMIFAKTNNEKIELLKAEFNSTKDANMYAPQTYEDQMELNENELISV